MGFLFTLNDAKLLRKKMVREWRKIGVIIVKSNLKRMGREEEKKRARHEGEEGRREGAI